jgi:hypothetical protein
VIDTEGLLEVAICWYDKGQWELLAELDPDNVDDDTYQEWRKGANKAINGLQSQGQKVVKIAITISEFVNWCKEQGIEPDRSARAEYAAMLLKQRREEE